MITMLISLKILFNTRNFKNNFNNLMKKWELAVILAFQRDKINKEEINNIIINISNKTIQICKKDMKVQKY